MARNGKTTDEATRTAIDPATIAQLQGRILDAAGNVWMGPGPAPKPTGASGEDPRRFDYPYAWNIWRQPEGAKSQESLGLQFAHLRQFAEQTVVRAAIETCKDQDEKVEYIFTLEPIPGEKVGTTAERSAKDPRVKKVADFFRSPDKRNDFSTWRRLAWEEILVADNLSIYWWPFEFPRGENASLVRNREEPYALRIIDGDTIEPLIDASGYEPAPPEPAYDQWIKGQPRKQFSSDLLLYAPFNPRVKKVFGFSPVEQLVFYISIALRRDLTKLSHYTDGNIPAGMWQAPEEWTPDQIERAQVWLNAVLSGDPSSRAKLIYMPGGKQPPIFPQDKILQDSFDEWLARLTGWVFNVPVTSLIKEQNRATAETSKEQATEEGAQTRTRKMTRFLNRVVAWAFGPEYADVIVTTRQQIETDLDTQSQIDDRNLRNGSLQIDELREREGRLPFGLPPGLVGQSGFVSFAASMSQAGMVGDGSDQEGAAAAPGGEPGQAAVAATAFNGAQVSAATAIVEAVSAGRIPRDAGIGQLIELFGKTPDQAERIMGSAGKPGVATTPTPNPAAEVPAARPVADPEKAVTAEDRQLLLTLDRMADEKRAEVAKAKRLTLARPDLVRKHARALAKDIAAFFAEQAPMVADAVVAHAGLAEKSAAPDFDWSGLIKVAAPRLEAIYAAGAKASFKDAGGSGGFDELNERAARYARTRGAEMVGMKYNAAGELVPNPKARWAITSTTREQIRAAETKAVEEGWSAGELRDAIVTIIDDHARAQAIAETDLAMAQNNGAMEGWKESGVVTGKEWLLGSEHGDPDVCDDNAAVGVVGIDDDFPSGDATAPAHTHCDCDVAAVVGE